MYVFSIFKNKNNTIRSISGKVTGQRKNKLQMNLKQLLGTNCKIFAFRGIIIICSYPI